MTSRQKWGYLHGIFSAILRKEGISFSTLVDKPDAKWHTRYMAKSAINIRYGITAGYSEVSAFFVHSAAGLTSAHANGEKPT